MTISGLPLLRRYAALTALASFAVSCDWGREVRVQEPTYRRDVADLFERSCLECHSGAEAEAGWRADTYLDAIGCVEATGEPAVLPADDTAPLIRSLRDEDHAGEVTEAEIATLTAWVSAGAPYFRGALHEPGFANPRSEEFHGKVLRDTGWARMLSADQDESCGRCHLGAPAVDPELLHPPEDAPDCRSCHDGPGGVLGCRTCHGHDDRGHPPADPCFASADDPEPGAHEAHVEGGDLGGPTLDCTACHPERDENVGEDGHGTGEVDIELDPSIAGEEAAYDAETGTCSVICHDRGGENPQPAWTDEGPLECTDCHLTPPEDHNPGACDSCHVEANEDGTELEPGPFHLDGEASLGDGSDRCGQCHGAGEDPAPDTNRHPNHLNPELGLAIDCETCHVVPENIDDEGHLDDETEGGDVTLSGRAGDAASYDAERHECTTICHDRGGNLPRPVWTDEGPLACDDCHQAPPEGHNPATCDTCHADVSPGGDALFAVTRHVNGVVDVGDGSGECGACHGRGADPAPSTGLHPVHLNPRLTAPIPCDTCHVVPSEIGDEGHLDAELGAEVVFSGLAAARGATPTYVDGTCTDVACHGANLPDAPTPVLRWDDVSGVAARCGACHGVPPAPPHTSASTCESLLCHGGEVSRWPDGLRISEAGRAVHIDGDIEAGGAP